MKEKNKRQSAEDQGEGNLAAKMCGKVQTKG